MNESFRKQFPILEKITYLDSAALVQKPLSVIAANDEYYLNYAINSHSPDSILGIKANKDIENTRKKIASFINAKPNEIIFTTGATNGLNLISQMLAKLIKKDDEIILSEYNHSSNIIPWLEMAKKQGAKVIFSINVLKDISKKTKIISLSQVNNFLIIKKDLKALYEVCKAKKIILIDDAAQAAIHERISLRNNCDVIVLSANKMYGPTGIGVLAVKSRLLSKLDPVTFGGGAVTSMNGNEWEKISTMKLYEPGTPNLAGLYQFNKALDFLKNNLNEDLKLHLEKLSNYLYDQLLTIKDIKIISGRNDFIALFKIKNIPSQDIVSFLGHQNIYVRSGDFCVKHLEFLKKNNGFIRVSLNFYNNYKDVDTLINALKKGNYFEFIK